MTRANRALLFVGVLAATGLSAQAQTTNYPVKAMDFDLWCTEQQHLPYDRCDKRLADDVQRFEAYRAVVERYEIPYLQEKEQKLRFDRDILHDDPIDKNPADKTQPPQATDGKTP